MARKSKSQLLADIHTQALSAFNRSYESCRDERRQCIDDRRFYSIPGAQWEGALSEQFANRPQLEVNKVHLQVMRIINEYRNNRITVDFVAKDGSADDNLADTCDALYRADEQDSCAEEAYDNAFEEAAGGGFGAWRLRTCYEDEYDDENEKQRIRIEPIYDADTSVFFDADAKRQDKSDAKHCWVIYSVTKQGYIDEWGDDPATWPKDATTTMFDWSTPDVVYIAEYYRVEEVRETVHIFKDITGKEVRYTDDELEDMAEMKGPDGEEIEGSTEAGIAMLADEGTTKIREKRVKRRKVRKFIMSGGKVLEDCGHIAGRHIPIVPVYGKRWFVDNVERMMGHVRLAKDPQRVKNMQVSRLAELAAISPTEKPILTPEQIAGHQVLWAEDNIRNNPYLLLNPIEDPTTGQMIPSGPIGYTKPPQLSPAMAALLQITDQDMAEILGSANQGDVMQPNMSGKAVELIQTRVDMQTFIYMSNMAKAMKRSGEIWLSMAKETYVEEGRQMKGIGEQGEVEPITLAQPIMRDGVQGLRNDLTKASFDVVADVGPSFTSRREAMVRALTGIMQMTQDPADMSIMTSMILMNMDGEGLGDIKQFYRRKLVSMGVIPPNDKEREEAAQAAEQPQQPDPQQVYLMQAAEKEGALAAKAMADTELTMAKVDETRAKTAETLAGIEMQPPPAA